MEAGELQVHYCIKPTSTNLVYLIYFLLPRDERSIQRTSMIVNAQEGLARAIQFAASGCKPGAVGQERSSCRSDFSRDLCLLCDYIGSPCDLNGPATCLQLLTRESHRAIARMM